MLSNGHHVEERAKPLGISTGLTISLRHTLVHPHTETREAPITRHNEHGIIIIIYYYYHYIFFLCFVWFCLLTFF